MKLLRRSDWFAPALGWPTMGEFAHLTKIPVERWTAVICGSRPLDLDMAIALSIFWDAPVDHFLNETPGGI
ncbi:hypothetical protein [Sphingomonas crocodyli]|uniref:XRE family transcriptional regulator n=1 Tax=Sphingomonas crocodyli TaxID=1979270 RepID=A0A437M5I9_9SPHN|nr:hypothetical protein [Sphingomonas crocodyli]RVT92981.1 hypothetical protein EOD43_03490 [Sphingomonas crocodyli]